MGFLTNPFSWHNLQVYRPPFLWSCLWPEKGSLRYSTGSPSLVSAFQHLPLEFGLLTESFRFVPNPFITKYIHHHHLAPHNTTTTTIPKSLTPPHAATVSPSPQIQPLSHVDLYRTSTMHHHHPETPLKLHHHHPTSPLQNCTTPPSCNPHIRQTTTTTIATAPKWSQMKEEFL